MHIDTTRAVADLLCSPKGADMLEINNILRSYDGVMTREGLFAFCLTEDLWLKIHDTPADGARYYALDTPHHPALTATGGRGHERDHESSRTG